MGGRNDLDVCKGNDWKKGTVWNIKKICCPMKIITGCARA